MKKITRDNLEQILTDHRLWLDTLGEKGKRAVLQGADLRGAKLHGADLRRVDLCGANLSGADLRRANLRRASLFGANLHEADLQGVDLREANLSVADLRGATLPLSIRDCYSFHRAKFSPEALPWLILHPQWPELKDSVQIVG